MTPELKAASLSLLSAGQKDRRVTVGHLTLHVTVIRI